MLLVFYTAEWDVLSDPYPFPVHMRQTFCMWGACMPWLSGFDDGALCLQQAVILGVLSFFMAWVVQAFFASVLLDIVNAGMPTPLSATHCLQGQWLCHFALLPSKVCNVLP